MTEKTAQPVVFVSREVDGATQYFVSAAWPEVTEVAPDQLASLPQGLATLDGDDLKIVCGNGTASYLKTGATDAGVLIFELVESTFEPLHDEAPPAQDFPPAPPQDQPEPAADPVPETDVPLVIDTRAEDEPLPEPRKTFGQVLASETARAFAAGDMTAHASLHNFEMAAGDFKRAAQQLVAVLPAASELSGVLQSIVSDL